jgi:hypothetical protein
MISLLLAGHEATADMFPLAVVALLQNPAQLDALRADDTRWPGAVEELLRHLTVIHSGIRRVATEDVGLSGVRIRAGEGVVVALQVANRDPAVDADPAPSTSAATRAATSPSGTGCTSASASRWAAPNSGWACPVCSAGCRRCA